MNENLQIKCLCCNSAKINKILKLVDSPLTDLYSPSLDISLKKKNYPLDLYYCSECSHLQLGIQVPPEESYTKYLYNSKVTPGLTSSFLEYARSLLSIRKDQRSIDILDVGSNDGSFLEACSSLGFNAIGVEPADAVAKYANKIGRRTINAYFDENLRQLLKESEICQKFDFISFNNVLANINNPLKALQTAKLMMKDSDSRIIIQTGYHPLQFSKGLFDYIYHEHYSYFNINSMKRLCNRSGLKISKYIISELRGGTIRFYIEKGCEDKSSINFNLERFSTEIEIKGLEKLIQVSKTYLKEKLDFYRNKKFKIVGFGASHSTGILVKNFDLENYLEYLVDENQDKFGLYMPGTSLKVYDKNILFNEEKTVVLILAWQYFDLIREKLINSGFNGPIIRPVLP